MPPSSSRSPSDDPLRFRAARAPLRVILGNLFRVRAEGLERLPDGPYVLASNHLSWLDPFLLLARRQRRDPQPVHGRPGRAGAGRRGGDGAVGATEGVLQPRRRGVAHFGAESAVPTVAMGLTGIHQLWRGKRITLRAGAAVQPSSSRAQDMAALETDMLAVLPPYEEPAGARPWFWLTTFVW